MPRSRSIAIQSERVERRSRLALTWPARLMAPPNSSNFSVSVVLPASGWEMIAKVRRRATSAARVLTSSITSVLHRRRRNAARGLREGERVLVRARLDGGLHEVGAAVPRVLLDPEEDRSA